MSKRLVFENHATKLQIKRGRGGFRFFEKHLGASGESKAEVYLTYAECEKAMQRYSLRYYGEKAKAGAK